MKIKELANQYISLLKKGETIQAIDQFYHDEISQFENNGFPTTGKLTLRIEEEKNLAKVKGFTLEVDHIAVNEVDGIAWGQMNIRFEPRQGQPMKLNEAFFLKRQDGLIIEQRFFYKGI